MGSNGLVLPYYSHHSHALISGYVGSDTLILAVVDNSLFPSCISSRTSVYSWSDSLAVTFAIF